MLSRLFGLRKEKDPLKLDLSRYKDIGEVKEEASEMAESLAKMPSKKRVRRALVKLAKMDWFENTEDTERLSFVLLSSGERFLSRREREFVAAVHSLALEMLLAREGVLV